MAKEFQEPASLFSFPRNQFPESLVPRLIKERGCGCRNWAISFIAFLLFYRSFCFPSRFFEPKWSIAFFSGIWVSQAPKYTSFGDSGHEVACSRCDTSLEVACAIWSGMKWHAHGATRHDTPLEVAYATRNAKATQSARHSKWQAPLEVAWSGMLTVRHATRSGMRHLKWHEVACSRCDTPWHATWSGIRHSECEGYTVSTPLEVARHSNCIRHSKWHATWSGIRHSKWHATWSGIRQLKWHATRSGICHSKWHATWNEYATRNGTPLEVAWSGMKWQNQNPPHLLVVCLIWSSRLNNPATHRSFNLAMDDIKKSSLLRFGPVLTLLNQRQQSCSVRKFQAGQSAQLTCNQTTLFIHQGRILSFDLNWSK